MTKATELENILRGECSVCKHNEDPDFDYVKYPCDRGSMWEPSTLLQEVLENSRAVENQ